MHTIKIFLASSQELKVSRQEFERFIRRKNDAWKNRDISFELIIWEDFIDAVSKTRKQDDYNKAIRESDILLVFVFSKVGKYTKEEFETGYDQFTKTGKPLIYTYFQFPRIDDGSLTKEDVLSVFEFEERLKQLNHFKIKFEKNSDLLLHFGDQLDKLFPFDSRQRDTNKTTGLLRELTTMPKHDEEIIGRDENIKELESILVASKKVVLMNGIGGIGKTTLAKLFVQLHKQDYDHIVWIDVKSQDTGGDSDMTIPEAFAYNEVLSKNLGLQFTTETIAQKFGYIVNALSNIEGKNLLVIDNARDDLNDRDIKNILPGPPAWQVIVTSRLSFTGFKEFEVEHLSEDYALELFKTLYSRDVEDQETKELLREISYHTLTIEMLAKTLSFPGQKLSIKETTERLRNKQLSSEALQRKIESAHSKSETEIYIHLIQTFNLLPLDEYDKWLMKQFAFLLPRQYKVSEIEFLLEIDDEARQKELQEGLNRLAKKGWLKYLDESYAMHRMIQQMVYYQLEPQLKDIAQLVDRLTDVIHFDTSTDFTKLFFLIPYVEFLLAQLKTEELRYGEIGRLQSNLGIVLLNQGEYKKARDLLNLALANALKNFDEQHPTVAVYRSNLATVYRNLGEYEKARDLLGLALESVLRNSDEQHPDIVVYQSNLANVYINLGEYEKAKDLQQAALAGVLKNLGEAHPSVDTYRSNLATAYRYLGESEKAKDLLETALESLVKKFGDEHPHVGLSRSNLGIVYRDLGEYEKARDLQQTALENSIKNFGEEHPIVAARLNNLAWVYTDMKKWKEAKDYFEKAIAILVKTVGTEHPNTKTTKESLEYLKNKMKEWGY